MGATLSPPRTPLRLKTLQHLVLLSILFLPSPEAVLKPVPKQAISQCQSKLSYPHATGLKHLMSIKPE